MRRLGLWIVNYILCIAFWFRYRIEVVGLEKVDVLKKINPAGILFLPNHVAVLLDPLMIAISMWPKYEGRPLIVDYMYKIPVFNTVLRMQNALAVPNVDDPNIRVTRAQVDAINEKIVAGLKKGDNFHVYPAGRLKSSPLEIIGGASMVYSVVKQFPECNIVLVRVKGLWGSSYSKAYTGDATPSMGEVTLNGLKHCLKNLLFFSPRRRVIVEFEPVTGLIPLDSGRRVFNEWLEHWYNLPDKLTPQQGQYPGESFVPVSLSMWKEVFPMKKEQPNVPQNHVVIPSDVELSVIDALSKASGIVAKSIEQNQTIGCDLGMDSIELVQAVIILEKKYGITNLKYDDIRTVRQLMQRVAASKK